MIRRVCHNFKTDTMKIILLLGRVLGAVALTQATFSLGAADVLGLPQEITLRNFDGSGKEIVAEVTESKDGQGLRRESTTK